MLPIVVLAMTLALARAEEALPADQIVAKVLKARGGLTRLRSVKTQRQTGMISFGPGNEGPLIVTHMRGGSMREDVRLPGQTAIRVTNGKSGWRISEGKALPLSAEEIGNMAGGADYDGPLVNSKAKGIRIEYAGEVPIEGRNTYKLVITMKNGDVRNDYIDAATFLEAKWEGKLKFDGKEFNVETYFRDYRKVDGLMYSFLLESNTLGTPIKQKIVFNKIEVNPRIDKNSFGKPEAQ